MSFVTRPYMIGSNGNVLPAETLFELRRHSFLIMNFLLPLADPHSAIQPSKLCPGWA